MDSLSFRQYFINVIPHSWGFDKAGKREDSMVGWRWAGQMFCAADCR